MTILSSLFGVTVSLNCSLFGGTASTNSSLFGGTVSLSSSLSSRFQGVVVKFLKQELELVA